VRDKIKGELITRLNQDSWVRILLNGGYNLVKNNEPPQYDNRVKITLKTIEGSLHIRCTENFWNDHSPRFVNASVNFQSNDKNLIIRVDNDNKDRLFHYNVTEKGKTIEDHSIVNYDPSEPPLNFCLKKVIEYIHSRYEHLFQEKWDAFNLPPLIVLSRLLSLNRLSKSCTPFPIAFVAFPRSHLTIQTYSRRPSPMLLIPKGIVIEKRLNRGTNF